ncbi:sugar ABC transporter permease [Candidatus Epulonipiscioides gigas]|nr:sugar ABC transporter permease [Epulopiscium sp. SCG-C07WGA-EpuloA2]
MKKNQLKETLVGFAFILPSFIGFMVFMVYPFFNSLMMSFMEWDMFAGFAGSKFVGLENYINVFKNEYFVTGLINNLKMLFIAVPILLILSLIVATIMNTAIFGRGILRTTYFMPYVTTVTAAAIVFVALFHEEFGPVNGILRSLGIENIPGWLSNPEIALITIMIFWIWRMLGYCILIYLAGLQNISTTYYEAASIDGASGWQKFRYITFPLVSPTTFFLAITMGIFSLSMMAEVRVMTNGGPGKSTYTMTLAIYQQAFQKYEMGQASAIAIIFLLIVLSITLLQWIGQKKWVNY